VAAHGKEKCAVTEPYRVPVPAGFSRGGYTAGGTAWLEASLTAYDKKNLSESDICAKNITPAIVQAGWDEDTQILREASFTKRRIIVRGTLVTRGKANRADYILYYTPNIPLALIEAKHSSHDVSDEMQQYLDNATTLGTFKQRDQLLERRPVQ
jgi:type I site-specific restriction endonuclease